MGLYFLDVLMAESISGKKRVNFAIGDERQYQQQSESTQRDNYANGKRLHFDPYSLVNRVSSGVGVRISPDTFKKFF